MLKWVLPIGLLAAIALWHLATSYLEYRRDRDYVVRTNEFGDNLEEAERDA